MKVTIKEIPPPPPAFVPFEITLRVETLAEARALRLLGGNGGYFAEVIMPGAASSFVKRAAELNGVTYKHVMDVLKPFYEITDKSIGYHIAPSQPETFGRSASAY